MRSPASTIIPPIIPSMVNVSSTICFSCWNFLRSRCTLSNRMPIWSEMTNKMRNIWCFHSSKRKSLQIRIDFKGERAPPPEQRVFFNSPAQKNLGKRYPTQWRDWNRSGSNSLAWNNSRINNYNGAFLSRRNYDSILRRQCVPAEILAVVFICSRREISMYVAGEKEYSGDYIPTKRKKYLFSLMITRLTSARTARLTTAAHGDLSRLLWEHILS